MARPENLVAGSPKRSASPDVGRSSPSASRISVVLPPPFGPAIATNSPASTERLDVLEHGPAAVVGERDVAQLDRYRHPSAFRSAARFSRMTEK